MGIALLSTGSDSAAPLTSSPLRRRDQLRPLPMCPRRRGSEYLNNRYHDPTTGVFLSVDPLVAKTGMPYLYGNGNPTTLSDPSGLDPDTSALVREHLVAKDKAPYRDGTRLGCTYSSGRDCFRQLTDDRLLADWNYTLAGRAWRNVVSPAAGERTEFDTAAAAMAALDALASYGGKASDAAGGLATGATVSAGAYIGENGKYVVYWRAYRQGLEDLSDMLGAPGSLIVNARWVGRAFVAIQAGDTALDSWRATAGHSTAYRLSYSAVKTAVTTGGSLAGATGGTKLGLSIGCSAGPWGCVVGGGLGALGGGLLGGWLAGRATDVAWEYTYERVAG